MKKKEKSVIDWLAQFAGTHKKLYIASVILAACGVACSIVPYVIMGDIVTKLIGGNRQWNVYLYDGIIMVVCWLARVVFHAFSTTCSHKATFHVLGNIRKQVCDQLAKVPLGLVKDTPSGSLKNIIVERIDSIETTLAHILPEFTSNLMAPVVVFIYLCLIDWRMALVSLISLPLGMLAYMGMMIGYEESFRNTVTKTRVLNDTAVEYINGIEVIKAFGREQNSYEKFKVAAKEGADCYIEWMRRCNVFFSIAMVLFPCTTISVLPIGGLFVMNATLSVSDFILCIILSLGLTTPLITVMSYSDDIGRLRTILGEVTGILTWEELERPVTDIEKPKDYSVTLENVTFGYHDQEVLHGINMRMEQGTVNALVGPSGSGKSTIAKLIASLWDTKTGSIQIGGVDIRKLSLEEYNRKVAYVSQDNYLFDDTIRENIRMGRMDATDIEVENVARKSGCHEFIMQLEHGYDTVVGDAGGHLSGGECQRIAIARAMLKDAPIVILDEATAYTDPENEAVIQSSVAKLVRGKTLIVIAHRLSTIADADKIFVIDNGRVVEEGTHKTLLDQGMLYAKMWQSHIGVKDNEKEGVIYA
ncbi:MAG: ABC transporter ATP-binding protein [Lachnospiraceae bacterium]|nr:ABC transporter ATP-binding protein [Lachnospiraceae bacterium]